MKISHLNRILTYQNLAFLFIIGLAFLDDWLRLPALVFSHTGSIHEFRRPVFEMLLVLAIWFVVNLATRRILKRIIYLEKFMRVCAWCRRINYQGEWMPLEQFMRQRLDTSASHGICKDCLEKQHQASGKTSHLVEFRLDGSFPELDSHLPEK